MEDYRFSILNTQYILRKAEDDTQFLRSFKLYKGKESIWTFNIYKSYWPNTGTRRWRFMDNKSDADGFHYPQDREAFLMSLSYLEETLGIEA